MKRYETLLTIAADSPAQLRRGDVQRVVDAANHAGFLGGFVQWLGNLRPDLEREIAECIIEVNMGAKT
jgi:hypothetical protein